LAGGSPMAMAARDPAPNLSRPVVVQGDLQGRWRRGAEGWSATLWTVVWRQGERVGPWRRRILVRVYGRSPPPSGSRLRVRGYLGRSLGLANRPPQRPGALRLTVKSSRLMEVIGDTGDGFVNDPLRALRRRLRRRLGPQHQRSPGGRFIRALVLGDGEALPETWRRGLRRVGLSHLLAVSGLHVALVGGLVWVVCQPLRRNFQTMATALGIVVYLLLLGARPSLLRATVMAMMVLAAGLLKRPPSATAGLGAAGGLLLLCEPAGALDLGLQLTLSATAGLILVTPHLARRMKAIPEGVRTPLAATAAAQICTWPWILPRFHLLTPWSPLANLVAVPWMSLTLAMALAWSLLTALGAEWGRPLLPWVDLAATPFAWPARWPTRWLFNRPVIVSFGGAAVLSIVVLWVLIRCRGRYLLALGLAVAGAVAVWETTTRERAPEVVMLDVGQGDSLLLRSGSQAVLVDGGGWRHGDIGARVLLPVLAELGVRRLQAVLMTHPDLDHCRGLVDLAAYLPVAEVWLSPGWTTQRCAVDLMTLPGVAVRPLWSGAEVHVGEWRLSVIAPAAGDRVKSANDRSLVVIAEARGRRILLTGDLEAAGEGRMLLRTPLGSLRSDLLKVPHHASRGSSTPPLLLAVQPTLSLVSVGRRNLYGHPSAAALDRLRRIGSRTLRTDQHGMIVLRIDEAGRLRFSFPGQPRP